MTKRVKPVRVKVRNQVSTEELAWREKCPLRRWLTNNGRGTYAKRERMEKLLAATRVTRAAVSAWLSGVALPKRPRIQAIEKVTGVTEAQWLFWFRQRRELSSEWRLPQD